MIQIKQAPSLDNYSLSKCSSQNMSSHSITKLKDFIEEQQDIMIPSTSAYKEEPLPGEAVQKEITHNLSVLNLSSEVARLPARSIEFSLAVYPNEAYPNKRKKKWKRSIPGRNLHPRFAL